MVEYSHEVKEHLHGGRARCHRSLELAGLSPRLRHSRIQRSAKRKQSSQKQSSVRADKSAVMQLRAERDP